MHGRSAPRATPGARLTPSTHLCESAYVTPEKQRWRQRTHTALDFALALATGVLLGSVAWRWYEFAQTWGVW